MGIAGKVRGEDQGERRRVESGSRPKTRQQESARPAGEQAQPKAFHSRAAETSRKRINQSVRQLSPPPLVARPGIAHRKVSPGAPARNSPRFLLARKQSSPHNPLSEQIENICHVLECINQQEKGKSPGDVNRMLRNLLKSELKKLGHPADKPRQTSVEPRAENEPQHARHPSTEKRDRPTPGHGKVGSLCYAPVFAAGHSRSNSKENHASAGRENGRHAVGAAGSSGKKPAVVAGKKEGDEDENGVKIKMYDAISGDREKLLSYTKLCIGYEV